MTNERSKRTALAMGAVLGLVWAGCGDAQSGPVYKGPANRQTITGPVQEAKPPGAFGRADLGDEALQRAQGWVDDGVMYSFAPNWAGYRTDCSGLVSYAWGLPAPGHTTYSLAGGPWDDGASTVIGWNDLLPGDALNFPGDPGTGTGHVMLFAGWADDDHYGFYVYEEYNFGHPASYLYHNLDTNWTGDGAIGAIFLPIRSTDR